MNHILNTSTLRLPGVIRNGLFGAGIVALLTTTALAGGFDRGGVNIDLLFDDSEVAAEASATIVLPQRELDNVVRDVNLSAPITGAAPLSSSAVDVDSDFIVPRFGLKFALTEHADCLGTYSEPFGADAGFGLNNAHSASSVDFEVETVDLGLTCSLNFSLGDVTFAGKTAPSKLRFIFGGSYLQLSGSQSRQTFADFAGIPAGTLTAIGLGGLNTDGVGQFNLSDEAFGFRVGLGYEIPIPDAKRGLRVSAIYSSKYDLDLTGTVDISGFNTPAARAFPVSKVTATSEIPQSFEVKAQAPIPGIEILADARVKWQDWSKLGSIPISGVISPSTGTPSTNIAFEPLFQDGLTVEIGAAAQLAEGWSGRVAGRWDKGTSTTFGFQTDTWSGSVGVQYSAEFVDISLGGSLGLLTSGSASGVDTNDPANDISYTFGSDWVGAFQGTVRFRF